MYNRASQSSASTYFLRQWVTEEEEEEQATRDSHLLTTIDQEMLNVVIFLCSNWYSKHYKAHIRAILIETSRAASCVRADVVLIIYR